MDNKITKKRLSFLLSYDWIKMILFIAVGIIVFELIYSFSAVRLTPGQNFKYYVDENLESYTTTSGAPTFYDLVKNGDVFSYDVKEFSYENLTAEYNVMPVRLSVKEGDAVFTDIKKNEKGECRADTIIDGQNVYTLNGLYEDACKYLSAFLKDEFNALSKEEKYEKAKDYSNLDSQKIEEHFNERVKKKRVYKNALMANEISVDDEYERISTLCVSVDKFSSLFKKDGVNYVHEDLFYRYTRFAQMSANGTGEEESYNSYYNSEITEGRENAIYGLRLENLSGGRNSVSEFFRLKGEENSENVVCLIFDFKADQPDLQYEAISFIVKLLEECSNILS